MIQVLLPRGIARTTFVYRPQNHRLIELKNFNFRNELFSFFSYEYDAIGNITGVTDLVGRAVFTYDRLDQLKSSQDLALSTD